MVDQFKTELKESGENMYKEVEAEMSKLSYGSWKTMMYESLVRACVIRYLDQKMGREAADKQLASDTERGFRWMAELEKQLLIYENNRREFRAFDDFMPVLVDWFEELGGRMDEVLAEYRRQQTEKWEGFKEKGPKVVSSVPTIGATDVDPGISEIIITFDRKMYPYGFEINDPEASEEFSNMEITEFPRFSEDSLQLIIPVKLEAGKKYKCILNSFAKGYFRDANKIPLYPVEITFSTAKK
jgi:hypothetical protein